MSVERYGADLRPGDVVHFGLMDVVVTDRWERADGLVIVDFADGDRRTYGTCNEYVIMTPREELPALSVEDDAALTEELS